MTRGAIRWVAVCVLTMVVSVASAEQYVIFKRLDQRLGVEQLPHPFTVWHIDALHYASRQIEAGLSALSQEAAFALAEQRLNDWGRGPLRALFLMSYSGLEKMHRFGLTETPSAVLLDDHGQVIQRWAKIDHGRDLLEGVPP